MKSDKSKDAKAYLQTRKYEDKDIEKYSISFISKDEESFNKFCKKGHTNCTFYIIIKFIINIRSN